MKTKLLLLLILSVSSIFSQAQSNFDYIKEIKPITWTKEIKNTTTTSISGNKTASTIAGGAIGHILFKKSLLGTLIGAAAGNALGTSSDSKTNTTITYQQVTGYYITTGSGIQFKTLAYYEKFAVIDLTKIKKE